MLGVAEALLAIPVAGLVLKGDAANPGGPAAPPDFLVVIVGCRSAGYRPIEDQSTCWSCGGRSVQ